ncbi:MAG: hypothetical protein WBD64_10460 [Candidatus Zixiibacteriota bacterium]
MESIKHTSAEYPRQSWTAPIVLIAHVWTSDTLSNILQPAFEINQKLPKKQKAFGWLKPKAPILEEIKVGLNLSVQRGIYFFFSSFILLTLFDRHLGQARSTIGPLGSKGSLNWCPHLKHLKSASCAIDSPMQKSK